MLASLIRSDQPVETGAMSRYPWTKKMERQYRFVSRFGEEVLLHKVSEDGKFIWLPRGLCPIGENDNRVDGLSVVFPKCPTPRPHQVELFGEVADFIKAGQSGCVSAYTGFGKSPAPHEPILMFDGSIKKAREVQVGDLLMGPDSLPRTVTQTNIGHGPMVRITPTKGNSWECNDVHILSLRCTSNNPYGYQGQIVNVTVRDWMEWPAGKKHVYKLWRTGVDFPAAKQRVDPYFMGLLLGDGSLHHSIGVTTMDPETVSEIYRQAEFYGCDVRIEDANTGKAKTYYLTQHRGNANRCALRLEIQQLGLQVPCGGKFVPRNYKVSDRQQRLALLAGYLDADGHLYKGCFEYCSKSKSLADDISYVARSLGLACYVGEKVVNGVSYWRGKISGATDEIPTRLARKKASPRLQKKDVTNTGFTVEELGDGEYRGIAIDGDHLYLLGDFTVTHNTVVGYHAAYVAQKKTLVVTTKEDIYQQWIAGARKFLGLSWADVGEIRQDKCEVIDTKFVVAMVQSLTIEGKYPSWIFDEFGLVIFDECHRMAADQFKAATEIIPAKLRMGLTATLERQDGKEELVTAHLGPVRARTQAQLMIPKILRFHTGWQCPRVLDKETKKIRRISHSPGKSTHIEKMLAADGPRNHLICQLAQDAHAKGRKVVVFSKFIDHLKTIHQGLTKIGVSGKDIGFYVGTATKAEARDREIMKGRDILLTTFSMMGEGTDIPWLSCMIIGLPISNAEQAIGRIRREYPDKPEPVVIDLLDTDSPLFNAYAGKRLQFYKRIKAKVIDF